MITQKSVPIGALRANPWNTNHVSPENEEKLAASIKKLGLFKPIVVRSLPMDDDACYEILGGEHRWHGARAAGLTEVPIVDLGAIDDIKAKQISIADNSRYGADNTLDLARLLEEIGSPEEIQDFLPYNDADVRSIFSSVNIATDELDLDAGFDDPASDEKDPDEPAPRPPKTHTIMRFKVSNGDAERLTRKLVETQRDNNFTAGDDLTNAGDALVQLILGGGSANTPE